MPPGYFLELAMKQTSSPRGDKPLSVSLGSIRLFCSEDAFKD